MPCGSSAAFGRRIAAGSAGERECPGYGFFPEILRTINP